jgi:RNA polymerase sigma-70 factor (ECF subfamily)
MSEPNLHDLAERLVRGDEAAFAELYDACADRLHRYLVVRTGSHEAASDALQAAFLRAVKSRRRFRKVENPIAYLFQIARNEAARAVARKRRTQLDEVVYANDSCTAKIDALPSDEAETATAALARLNADDRELVELKIYASLTFLEIANVTGKPVGTVATQYRRALESLRPWLIKQYH